MNLFNLGTFATLQDATKQNNYIEEYITVSLS